MTAYKILMGALVVILFCVSVALSEWHAKTIEKALEDSEARINSMSEEHARAMTAAEKAIREREAVFERERERYCKAQNAIGNNPDFCRVPIPDDFRLLWENDDVAGSKVPTAGAPAGSD